MSLPAKKTAKKSKPAKKAPKAAKPAKVKVSLPSQGGAKLECAECNKVFTSNVGVGNAARSVGTKFSCPNCAALFEVISLQESRITVTILAKGETRTYGKTYDLSAAGYAPPL